MAKNSSITQLDANQVVKRVFDDANDSIRVEMGLNSGISIQLDSASDSVTTVGNNSGQKVSLSHTTTGVVLPAFACVGMTKFNLYIKTTADITGAQVCTLEISPSDTDNLWIATALTITPDATSGNTVTGTAITSVVARRARVSIAAAITTGTFDLYLNAAAV